MGPAAETVPGGGSCRENAWTGGFVNSAVKVMGGFFGGVKILLYGIFPLTYIFATKINFYTK